MYLAHYRRFGRTVYAIGGYEGRNEQSARLMGLPVNTTKVLVYTMNGFCSALAGIALGVFVLSGHGSYAYAAELDVIASVVMGGTALSGGQGYVFGTLFGVLIFGVTQTLIQFNGTLSSWWTRIVIGVPGEITQVEKRAVKESAEAAGAREVDLVAEPMAAAIGAGLPVTEPISSMIVDIGGGTTEVAVISLSGIVYTNSVRVAGDKIDQAIMQYIKREYNLLIGERTAEIIKIMISSAASDEVEKTIEVKGRDLVDGIPKIFTISSEEIRKACQGPIRTIIDAVRVALEQTPPELAADIVDRGIVLTGGGALYRNLDRLLREETGLPVIIAEDPLSTVARGAGKLLDDIDLLRDVTIPR